MNRATSMKWNPTHGIPRLFTMIFMVHFLILGGCREASKPSTPSTPMEIFLEEAGEWSYAREDSLCYLDLASAAKGDSFAAVLMIRGTEIHGTLLYAFEDGSERYGKLKGEMQEDRLLLNWSYISEGRFDSVRLEFQRKDGVLLRKRGPDSDSTQRYHPVNCDQIPKVDFDLGLSFYAGPDQRSRYQA